MCVCARVGGLGWGVGEGAGEPDREASAGVVRRRRVVGWGGEVSQRACGDEELVFVERTCVCVARG